MHTCSTAEHMLTYSGAALRTPYRQAWAPQGCLLMPALLLAGRLQHGLQAVAQKTVANQLNFLPDNDGKSGCA
jgi:hypothetical protein